MDDLIAFLRARLDEDAAIAGAASAPSTAAHWSLDKWFGREQPHSLIAVGSARHPTALGHFTADPVPTLQAQHIARHDPARVLAEVDAKRRALDQFEYWNQRAAQEALNPPSRQQPGLDLGLLLDALNPILMDFARPYVKHPDFKARWWIPESPEEDEGETPADL